MSVALGHNGGPGLDEWVDYRHALMVAIRDDLSLPPRARMLGVMVCTYMTVEGNGARPSARTLASVTGYGVNTISKIMALIEQAGLMHINKGVRGSKTTYSTAQSYEDAIATYVKGARGRYAETVTLKDGEVSLYEGDTHIEASLSGGDTRRDTSKSVTTEHAKVSPNCGEVSPNCGEVSLSEGDRRIEDKKIDYSTLSDRLINACNGALDNPVNCQGLLNVATPIMWMNEGADLDLDILPTLWAMGKKHHGKRINSWNYFTGAIAEARDRRMTGLPKARSHREASAKRVVTGVQKRIQEIKDGG